MRGPKDLAFEHLSKDYESVATSKEKNILIEYRYYEGRDDRIPSFVAELVQLKVDVIIVLTLSSIREAKRATKTIPIVMVAGVDSGNRPGRKLGTAGRKSHRSDQTLSGIERKTSRIAQGDDSRDIARWCAFDDRICRFEPRFQTVPVCRAGVEDTN